MKTVFKYFGILQSDYEDASQREQGLLQMSIPATFFSGITAGTVIGYCIQFFLEILLLSIGIGLVSGALVFMHHKTLFSSLKKGAIIFVLIVSLLFGTVVSLPFKCMQQIPELEAKMIESNQARINVANAEAEIKIEELFRTKDRLLSDRQTAANSFTTSSQPLIEARRNLNGFMSDFEQRQESIRLQAIANSGYVENLRVTKLEVFSFFIRETFDGELDSELLIFFIYFFLFFLIEGSSGLIALGLKGSSYERKIRQREEALKLLEEKDGKAKMKIAQDLNQIPIQIPEIEVISTVKESIRTGNYQNVLLKYNLLKSRQNLERANNAIPKQDFFERANKYAKTEETPKESVEDEIPSFDYENLGV